MDIEDMTLRQLSERVEKQNHQQSLEDLAYDKWVRDVQNLVRGLARAPTMHYHKFAPYSNPDQHPDCVRCPWPKEHAVHNSKETA